MRGFTIARGQTVEFDGHGYEILKVLNTESISARHLETNDVVQLQVKALKPFGANRGYRTYLKLIGLTAEQRDHCAFCLRIIRPLIFRRTTKDQVDARAKLAKRHISTIYRWVQKYEISLSPYVFLTDAPGGGKGKGRIPERVEEIITEQITSGLKNRLRKKTIFKNIQKACQKEGFKQPCYPTFLQRRKKVSKKDEVAARSQSEAETKFGLKFGHYNEAKWPNHIIQIDHSELNIILVGDIYRESIGRPWVTLAIDIYTRCIVGFYLAMEEPSGFSVGNCLSMAILSKDKFMADLGLEAYPWENYGFFDVVHADNGPDFRAYLLKETCLAYGFDLIWRPVGKAKYGGHIESLIGDFKNTITELPGTTFLNPTDRGDYDSDEHAAMTFREFLRWFTLEVVKHNHKVHSGIDRVPYELHKEGILHGSNIVGARGICPAEDPRRLVLDFMPYKMRTIQRHGVQIENNFYVGDELAPWLYSGEGNKQKFRFAQDYRDVSVVHFFDPNTKEYYKIFAPTEPMSLWEQRARRKQELMQENMENAKWQSVTDQAEQEQEKEVEEAKSKTERKKQERRRQSRKPRSKPKIPPAKPERKPSTYTSDKPVLPAVDIETW